MEKKILSLCMPTYGRHECVQRALENYEKILGETGLGGKVELCISDNNSTDETKRIVEKFAARGKISIRYAKNEGYFGSYDRNIVRACRLAGGEYLHFVSNEDIYDAAALKNIVRRLEDDKPDIIVVVSYNKPFMPALGKLPDTVGSADEFIRLAFSKMGSELGYFVGFCWYVLKRQDFLEFLPIADRNEYLYRCHIIHTPLFLLALKKSKKMIVLQDDYRAKGVENKPDVEGFNTPENNARIYYNLYFDIVRKTRELGIISGAEYEYFRKNFFWYLLANMFKLRTRMYPWLYYAQRGSILKNIEPFEKSCHGLKLAFFRFYAWLLFCTPIPFHLVYRAFIFYKRSIKKEQREDYHEFYREKLEKKDGKWVKNEFA